MKPWREMKHLAGPRLGMRYDGSVVLRDLPSGTQPVARLRYVDGDDLFVNWIWDHQRDSPRMMMIPRDLVTPALDDLARALPHSPCQEKRVSRRWSARSPTGSCSI